ncbi:MAG: IS21 family transposase [Actinobacteria bacterium]|nr:IS21 family transposase [Actinomycetota bacterium]
MAFREVSVIGVREILRLWLMEHGTRAIARHAQVDRKTVRRYIEAAQAAGLSLGDAEDKLTDDLLASVLEAVRVGRRPGDGRGCNWELLVDNTKLIESKLKDEVKLTKIANLLHRRTGEVIPYRTLHRFCVQELGHSKTDNTVRVDDCEPGSELQVDFGKMGLLFDPDAERRRVLWALIFTSVFSRHMFVWLTYQQTLASVIDGFEAAWSFYQGVFKVVIPDNLKAIVDKADATNPRINDTFYEYAQARGFVIDPARVAHPKDKPRVERGVSYVRESFFKGEDFKDLSEAQHRAPEWCLNEAGLRIHGTTKARPAEVFSTEERALLLPAPDRLYDLPHHSEPKVHPDHHIAVLNALYSMPTEFVGKHVKVRADSQLVKAYYQGELVKVHPRKPAGGRSTDADDYPADKRIYATRDLARLVRLAYSHGHNVGTYAERVLDNPLPWTKMRQVYRLLGLVRRYGAGRVEAACSKALELDVVDVTRIARMLERALEDPEPGASSPPDDNVVVKLRFARSAQEFTTDGGDRYEQ